VSAYTVPAGDVGVHAKTLVASTVDTVTFTSADLPEVEVLTDGTADIYVTFGSTKTPTVAGTQCWRVPAGSASAVLPVHTSGDTIVKLISSGTPGYSVART
jgi:hypothetical protein